MKNANGNECSRRLFVSLVHLKASAVRMPWLGRGLAAGLALSLVLAFTPCCNIFGEVYAASSLEEAESHHAPGSAAGGSHSHEPDGQGGLCGKWLDNAFYPGMVSSAAFTSSWEGKLIVPLAPERYSLISPNPDAIKWRLLQSQFPPPHALYLRFARLLI